MQMQAQQQLI
jgi:hypothetical protein